MADSLEKKVIYRLIKARSCLIPVAAGATAAMLGWGADSVLFLTSGIFTILGTAGIVVTNLFWNFDKLVAKMKQEEEDKKEAARLYKCDVFKRTLSKLSNSLTECFGDMQTARNELALSTNNNIMRAEILEDFDNWFNAQMVEIEKAITPPVREHNWDAQKKRVVKKLIRDVTATIESVRTNLPQGTTNAAEDLRRELDETMRIAKRTEEHISSIGKSALYDPKEFE